MPYERNINWVISESFLTSKKKKKERGKNLFGFIENNSHLSVKNPLLIKKGKGKKKFV